MTTPSKRSPWKTFLLVILGLGLLGSIAGFLLFSHKPGSAASPIFIFTNSTVTPITSKESETVTATPFQPLPTETLTPTSSPTATITLTPTLTITLQPTNTATPKPTETYQGGVPPSAFINGITGYKQSHNLSCESRSAVDWARYYGVAISEEDFQANLPLSENPERGFVGFVDDLPGQIPPNSYGVHASPVAKVLRAYGLSARAQKKYSYNALQRQIASGNPVIVWVIGNVWYGYPLEYFAPNGKKIIVAHYEHTAIVIGYDEYGVTLLDNDLVYWRSLDDFLNSWAVLNNMVIVSG